MLSTSLETIYSAAQRSQLSRNFFRSVVKPAIDVNSKLHIQGDAQTVIIKAAIIAYAINNDDPFVPKELASFFNLSNISFLKYTPLLEDLVSEHILRRGIGRNRGELILTYSILPDCLDAIRNDREYTPLDYSGMSSTDVLVQINRWLSITDNNCAYYKSMVRDIRFLLDKTQHLSFTQQLLALQLDDAHLVMFLIAACFQIIRRTTYISSVNYEDILSESYQQDTITTGIDNGDDVLATLHLLENDTSDGVADRGDYILTEHACQTVLADFSYKPRRHSVSTGNGLINPADIAPKSLFYNEREGKQIQRLASMLQPDKLANVRQRLHDSGLRTGFCILFHGAQPGTGKTETVLQLCRQTGHPIYQVKMSEMRSKWVGESEKQVQAIFDNYRRMVETSRKQQTPLPILFLNEADALLGARMQSDDMSSVDKMNNTMQNIILQNMEDLDGVMIATTNLTANLDKAMERRWLMTILFEKPEASVRSKIFCSMLPQLTTEDAQHLAVEFPTFAGGQIENVTRRLKIEQVLEDVPFTLDNLRRLCREEGIAGKARRPIGF